MSYKAAKLTPTQEADVRLYYKTVTVPDLAKKLKISTNRIYGFMDENNLTPFKSNPAARHHNHPFRKANRRLESVCLARKIEKRRYNPK